MIIGITGAEGFIGSAFLRWIEMTGEPYRYVVCPRSAFSCPQEMDRFVTNCNAIVHFAGLSRHEDGEYLLKTNLALTSALIAALERTGSRVHVYLASTTHENRPLPYHESKRKSRELLEQWADCTGNSFTTLLMPNTFGPCARPFFNSVIPTFCCLAARGRVPEKIEPAELKLIHIRTLCRNIFWTVRSDVSGITSAEFPHEYTVRLDEVWRMLCDWEKQLLSGKFPQTGSAFEADLLSTYLFYRP